MRLPLLVNAAALTLALGFSTPAQAIVNLGDTAPNFTKDELDFPSIGQTTPRSLADYSGKVIVFFLLGYS